ncbi:thioredoxin domain-containing protein 17 isoform X1 [Hyperolius riggenbachi]|uniref:thioredoxin domain-containing protein 17 isoform X1 n=1 Tax=Hyperolius riggenbachi TaxID=752182 RepID=UPI0035A3A473
MANYTEVKVHGFEEYVKEEEKVKGKAAFALFSGDKDEAGESWCPDCVKAEPIIRGELCHLPEGAIFIYCQVGDRPYWKDPTNPFKQKMHLTGVPTLAKVGTPQKLTEEQCFNAELIRMLFEE